jgi:hypothetical protein
VREDGSADFAAIKERIPALFGMEKKATAHAGAGTKTDKPAGGGMNAFIRQAAGIVP